MEGQLVSCEPQCAGPDCDTIKPDPAGDIISPRIQYLESWIRDCQRHNRVVSALLTKAEDQVRDLRVLVDAKNAELRELRKGRTV